VGEEKELGSECEELGGGGAEEEGDVRGALFDGSLKVCRYEGNWECVGGVVVLSPKKVP